MQQIGFMRMLPRLIDMAFSLGFEITGGDLYRDKRCPYGSKTSKHHDRLAVDLNLFKDGKYLTDTEDYRCLGEYWQRLGGIWGGEFVRADGNHFEWPKETKDET